MFRATHRVSATLAVFALLLAVVPTFAQAEGGAGDRFTILRTWQPTTPPPGMSVDTYAYEADPLAAPATRRLYMLNKSWLSAYDLDSLEPVGAGVHVLAAKTGLYNPRWTSAYVDPVSEELWIAVLDADGSVRLDGYVSTPAGVVKHRSVPVPGLAGREVRAIYRHPARDMLWAAASDTYPAGTGGSLPTVLFSEIGLRPGDGEHWTKRIDGCPGLIKGNQPLDATALGLVNGSLYFGCRNVPVSGNTRVPIPGGAARLGLVWSDDESRTSPGEFHLFGRDGDYTGAGANNSSAFDPRSGRLALGARSFTIDVFDTTLEAYIGTIDVSPTPPSIFGLDGTTGRVYTVNSQQAKGLAAIDIPATPLAQGDVDGSFSDVDGAAPRGSALAIDSTTDRLIIAYNGGKGPAKFLVVHDAAPPYAPSALESVDVNTNGGPEVPGVTQAKYSASATGFGSRYRQIGGTAALIANTVGLQGFSEGVRPGTREMRFAALERLTMGIDEAVAEAAGGYADEANTRADLYTTQPRDPDGNPVHQPGRDPGDPQPFPPLADWPWRPANCSDFGGSGKEADVRGARVSCRAALPTVGAYAVQDRTDAASVVVGHSEIRADAGVDGLRGTITTATATAKDIDVLGGLLRMQEVSAKATASAHGQPGTTSTSYARTVKEVTLSGQPLCGEGADTERCDIRTVEREVNTRLKGRVRIHFPTPEESRSKGGYQAVVQRGLAELLEEIAINEQSPDELDVPAVVITVFQDNSQAARTIVELASVAVEARYGISGADDPAGELGGFGDGDEGSPSLAGAMLDGGGTPVFGMSPADAAALAGLPRPTPRLGAVTGLRPAAGFFGGGRHLIFQGIAAALDVFPAWVLLLIPVYLSARRWLLLERAALLQGGRA